VLLGLIGGWIGLALGGTVHHEIGPLQTSMRVLPTWEGGTTVDIPPLGELELETHDGPLGLRATLQGVDVPEAEALVAQPELISTLKPQAVEDLRWEVQMAALRALVSSLVGAAVLSALALRRVSSALVGTGSALVAVGCSAAIAFTSWNPAALAEPRYTGLLTSAPSVVGSAESIVTEFSEYGDQLARIVQNVGGLYTAASTLPVLQTDDAIKVLHVSDLHLAPHAWDLIRTVSKQYDVDVIVDSGDITDHGSQPENYYVEEIATLDVPYVWVRGNHDSVVTQDAIERIDNAVVLDGRPREVAGLRFIGVGDPTFTPDKTETDSHAVVAQAAEQLAVTAEDAGGIDVAVFHDPVGGEALDGTANMALFGHRHFRKVTRGEEGTWLMQQGSTGGSGLRALEPEEPASIQMSVLYVDRDSHHLRAYDDIRIGGLGLASAQIKRQVVDDPDGRTALVAPEPTTPPAPAPAPSAPPSAFGTPGPGLGQRDPAIGPTGEPLGGVRDPAVEPSEQAVGPPDRE
jgi:predicted phosphodiesterase